MSEPIRSIDPDDAADATAAANDRIAAKARQLRFGARVPFLCECGDADCGRFVLLEPDDYDAARRAGPVVSPEHGDARTAAEKLAAPPRGRPV